MKVMREAMEPVPVAFVDGVIREIDEMSVEDIERAVQQDVAMVVGFSQYVRWLDRVTKAMREYGVDRVRDLPTSVMLELEVSKPVSPEEA